MTANKIYGREIAYVSPVLDFLDVENEGMLCVSGELLIEDWEVEVDTAISFN